MDEPARQSDGRAKQTHCFVAISSGGVSPPFCMLTMPIPGTFTSLGLMPRPTLPKLVPPLNALKPARAENGFNAQSTLQTYHTKRTMHTLRRREAKLVTLALGHEPAARVQAEGAGRPPASAVPVRDDERLCVSAVQRRR